MLPLEVLQQAQAEFVDYNGCGMSVTEMSHRSKQFDAIHNECIALIRELMGVPDTRRRFHSICSHTYEPALHGQGGLRGYGQLCEKGV